MNKLTPHKDVRVTLPEKTGELLDTCRKYLSRGYYHHAVALLYYADLRVLTEGGDRLKVLLMLAQCTLDLQKYTECERVLELGRERSEELHDRDRRLAFGIIEARLKLATNSLDEADSIVSWALELLDSWYNKELEIECFILRSMINQRSGYAETALEFAHLALKNLGSGHSALLAVEAYRALAMAMAEGGDGESALKYFNIAIENCNIEGNQYLEATLYMEAGNFVGRELNRVGTRLVRDPARPPAWYFARALHLFHHCGTVRELERANQGFKKFGRRESDHLGNKEINDHSSRLSYLLGRLAKNLDEHLKRLMELHAQGHQTLPIDPAVEHILGHYLTTHNLYMEVEKQRRELVEAGNQLGVERKRLESLVEYGRKLSSIPDEQELVATTLSIILEVVEANGAAFLPDSRESSLRGSMIRGNPTDSWHRVAVMVLNSGEPVLPDFMSFKARKATPVSSSGDPHTAAFPLHVQNAIYGVIYVDKRQRGTRFSPMDCIMIESLARQVGALLDNSRMQRMAATLAQNNAATLDAISDGVITLDGHRTVLAINRSALALLDMPRNKVLGAPFDTLPVELPKDFSQLRNETLLRFPRGEVLTVSRPFLDHLGEHSGEVLTMTELRKVKKAVQTIAVAAPRYTFEDLNGRSRKFMAQVHLARIAAQSDSDILITGESGTGKEVFAQAIHNAGSRSEGPFVAINCAAIPGELLESELFGYEEGAFTGAVRGGKPGKFELAEGGTLLLDEIGDMPLEMQVKLLRVLQERQYRRIGGTLEYVFDVRIISTTNRPLDHLVELNQFRSDLLYRLRVMHLHIPPLRERPDDIPKLTVMFLQRFSAKTGKTLDGFSDQVMEVFTKYHWPGNIRQLEHVVEAEVNIAGRDVRVIDEVPAGIAGATTEREAPIPEEVVSLDEMERIWLLRSLSRNGYSATKTARDLGVSRGTIYNKIKRFHIDIQRMKWEDTNG